MDMFIPATEIRSFVWDTFASHYIELVKERTYSGNKSSISTLHFVLQTVLKLLAPITPFITDGVYRELYGKSVHLENFPEEFLFSEHPTEKIKEFNELVWTTKKGKGLSLKDEIELEVPANLKMYESDLKKMHHLK